MRPSADLLFESAAAIYKDRAIVVVLTGTGSDGAMGVQAIKKMGGTVVTQDEKTSEFYGRLGAAIHTGNVLHPDCCRKPGTPGNHPDDGRTGRKIGTPLIFP